jgi:hypothetical protein
VDGVSVLVPYPLDPKGLMSVQNSPFRRGKLPNLPTGTPVKSELAYFADAYAALLARDYAQACEWLYQETGDARFVTELLEWVKKHEVIQPAHGWAYAMEYAYEKPAGARPRARNGAVPGPGIGAHSGCFCTGGRGREQMVRNQQAI